MGVKKFRSLYPKSVEFFTLFYLTLQCMEIRNLFHRWVSFLLRKNWPQLFEKYLFLYSHKYHVFAPPAVNVEWMSSLEVNYFNKWMSIHGYYVLMVVRGWWWTREIVSKLLFFWRGCCRDKSNMILMILQLWYLQSRTK